MKINNMCKFAYLLVLGLFIPQIAYACTNFGQKILTYFSGGLLLVSLVCFAAYKIFGKRTYRKRLVRFLVGSFSFFILAIAISSYSNYKTQKQISTCLERCEDGKPCFCYPMCF